MKKFLTTLLLVCACGFAAAGAAACNEEGNGDSSSVESSSVESVTPPALGAERNVSFSQGEGYTVQSNALKKEDNSLYHREGFVLTFTVELGAFYSNSSPVAYANGDKTNAIVPNKEGVFSYTMGAEDVAFSIEGVRKDVSNMYGTGAMDDAFLVTKPIDLLYIAEQVNKGNPTYTQGAYIVANDIDCKGEELDIIGDNSTEYSVFSGAFSCATNQETGEMERYTISNFVINSEDTSYVGLFGAVLASSMEGSAQFYGIRIADFEINAGHSEINDSNKALFCGGLIGYGVGARLFLCDAVGGDIFVNADDTYFAFTGGLVGYFQGLYDSATGTPFPAEIAYSAVDTNVMITDGVALYAGGVAGLLATNYPYGANAFVHNSYSLGNVSGALRAGGVVGGLGQYTSASNCYASGNVSAKSSQPKDKPGYPNNDYCHAYAGGIVGHAENDTVVHDAFYSGSKVNASTAAPAAEFAHTHRLVGGGDDAGSASVNAKKYVTLNCLETVDLSDKTTLTKNLGWADYDWIFKKDTLPVINYETAEGSIVLKMNIEYLAKDGTTIKVNGESKMTDLTFFDSSTQSNSYGPIGSLVMGDTNIPVIEQVYKADNGYLSYGFFFDEECTQPIPVSYVPTQNFTMYVGFADATPVVGKYLMKDGETLSNLFIELKNDGTLVYSDGATEDAAAFTYDGERILVFGARLARYYQGEVTVNTLDTTVFADATFDLNRYAFFNFAGKVEGADGAKKLSLWDGTYFTETAPLVYGVGTATATNTDAFAGEWTKSANLNKRYFFDGNGGWTYGDVSGAYTVDGSVMTMTKDGQPWATATFNSDGFLEVTTGASVEVFHAEDSLVGSWKGTNYQLNLLGITKEGYGIAEFIDENGYITKFYYERSETDDVIALYYPKTDSNGKLLPAKELLFGYGSFNANNQKMRFVLPYEESESGYVEQSLQLYDVFTGDWISSVEAFAGATLHFDGLGKYGNGTLVITKADGTTERVVYTTDGTTATFAYGGTYELTYDDIDDRLIITATEIFLGKDELASYDFVDINGNRYVFDGRSPLGEGKLTVGNVTYAYKANGDIYDVYNGATKVGAMEKKESHFLLTVNETATKLYLSNKFIGDWAISAEYALFEIGPTDLNGVIKAKFKGAEVEVSFLNSQVLTFYYRDASQNGLPYTYYVFIKKDAISGEQLLALSEFPYLIEGNYIVCSKANAFYGVWEYKPANGLTMQLRFDGVTSNHVRGYAELTPKLEFTSSPTGYYYNVQDKGTLMWSRELLAGRTWYYRLQLVDVATLPQGAEYFTRLDKTSDKVLVRTEVDGLYLVNATDAQKNAYFFDYSDEKQSGVVVINEQEKYLYAVRRWENSKAILVVTDIVSGDSYKATLDYANLESYKFILESKVDRMYLVSASDGKNDDRYRFDYSDTLNKDIILVNDQEKYTYKTTKYENNVATLIVTEIASGVSYNATLDCSDSANYRFTLGAKI